MPPVVDLVQNTLDGLMTGSAYALLGLGFTLIYGVMGRLNLAFGPSVMVGVYFGVLVSSAMHGGIFAVGLATIAGAALAGAYVERLCFAPMKQDAALASLVASFAIWMHLEELATLALPGHTQPYPALATGTLSLGVFSLRLELFAMLIAALAVMLALNRVLYRTRLGLALRAVADNPAGARVIGINVGRTLLGAFVLASAVGGVAGWLIAGTDQQATPMLAMWATFKGLIAMMLGGLGSLPGAVAGGFLLGVVEAHVQWAFGPQARELAAFGLLLAVLLLRPGGLAGRRVAGAAGGEAARA